MLDDACFVLENVKEIYKSNLNHPYVAFSIYRLGALLYKTNQYEKASIRFSQASNIFKYLSKDQPHYESNLALTLNNAGSSLLRTGKRKEALGCFKKSVEILTIIYEDKNHPDIIQASNNLKAVNKLCFLNPEDL